MSTEIVKLAVVGKPYKNTLLTISKTSLSGVDWEVFFVTKADARELLAELAEVLKE